MCGIAGFCNFKGDKQRNIKRMKRRIYHRGPDAGGSFFSEDGQVVLGHRRLSIIDLSESGSQPMASHSGRYVIAYNGEIYNYKQVRNLRHGGAVGGSGGLRGEGGDFPV